MDNPVSIIQKITASIVIFASFSFLLFLFTSLGPDDSAQVSDSVIGGNNQIRVILDPSAYKASIDLPDSSS